jgi:hypothetical protein
MVPALRWLAVAAVAITVAAAPTLVRAVPPRGSDVSAVALASRIRADYGRGWSGEVASTGYLQLPITTSTFSGVARLLGQRTELRVWWRGPKDWRVDRLRSTGESDLAVDGGLEVTWSYETRKVRVLPYSSVRLPDDSDVVPTSLAHRMLSGARPSELSRLPSRRIAGRSAAGLRLVPSDRRSTIGRVDIWADSTGVPLRVDVYAAHADRQPVLSTRMVTFDPGRPSTDQAHMHLDPRLSFTRGEAVDEAAGANVFAPFAPPDEVAGLPRLGDPTYFGAVGVYGRGPTALLAIPLRDFVAGQLRDQLSRSSRSRDDSAGVALEVGPVSILLTDVADGHFLVVGTVTPATLVAAARDLAHGVRRTAR